MNGHPEDALFAYQLGALTADEANRVHTHLQKCVRCGSLLAQVGEDIAQLALTLPPVQPQPLIRESLLHSLGEINRFTELLSPLREQLGKSAAETQKVLDRLDDPGAWSEGDLAGVQLHPVNDTHTFVRLTPGTAMPLDETTHSKVLILQGTCRGTEGTMHNAGDVLDVQGDKPFDYIAMAGPDLIYLSCDNEA